VGQPAGIAEDDRPAYQDIRAEENSIDTRPGATVRVIAGELFGLTGPGRTRTPISYAHVTLDEHADVTTPLPADQVVLAYAMTGGFRIGDTQVDEGVLAVIEGAPDHRRRGAGNGEHAGWPRDQAGGHLAER
jgi:redox-sensitive bicupin YhaK (pirin superfamily)